jgi:hypothetical protein
MTEEKPSGPIRRKRADLAKMDAESPDWLAIVIQKLDNGERFGLDWRQRYFSVLQCLLIAMEGALSDQEFMVQQLTELSPLARRELARREGLVDRIRETIAKKDRIQAQWQAYVERYKETMPLKAMEAEFSLLYGVGKKGKDGKPTGAKAGWLKQTLQRNRKRKRDIGEDGESAPGV